MDPTANLEEQRRLWIKFLDDWDNERQPDAADVYRFAELASELDLWIRREGFLPREWHEAQERARARMQKEASRCSARLQDGGLNIRCDLVWDHASDHMAAGRSWSR
jgi:hypothetical protein